MFYVAFLGMDIVFWFIVAVYALVSVFSSDDSSYDDDTVDFNTISAVAGFLSIVWGGFWSHYQHYNIVFILPAKFTNVADSCTKRCCLKLMFWILTLSELGMAGLFSYSIYQLLTYI